MYNGEGFIIISWYQWFYIIIYGDSKRGLGYHHNK